MHASECWIEEVKPHCATDQPMSSTQCVTFLLSVLIFRWVPRSGLSSLQKQFRKTYYDCLRRICDVFMPLLCALFVWGNCRVYGDVSVSGWKHACFNDKVSFITIASLREQQAGPTPVRPQVDARVCPGGQMN